MVQNVAPLVAELDPEDIYVLSGIEHGMRYGEWVDRNEVPKLAGLSPEEVDYRLERTLKRKLVEKRTIQYEGYRLTFEGYDTLALWAFAKRDSIEGVGAKLGIGKESDVYEVQSFQPMALKFHREGIGNFRKLDREREYTADREHTSDLYTARIAAEREYELLEALYPEVAVPRPVDQNRHAIVMEKLDGGQLSRVSLDEDEVLPVLTSIVAEATRAYNLGYVHADLSEYNVFVSPDRVVLFDWPQAVPVDHENAIELLRRDISGTLAYFRRKYPSVIPASLAVDAVVAGVETGSPSTAVDAIHRGAA